MRTVLHQILTRPTALSMACCAITLGGLFAVTKMPLGLAPSLEFPALSIHTAWGGASAESIEQTLTAPVEEIVSSMRGIRKVRSSSREGRSGVTAEFDPRTDMNRIRLELNERLTMFARGLPRGVPRPAIERYIPKDIRQLQGFLTYSLSGSLSRTALVRLAREAIIPCLMRIRGVAQTELYGGEEEELRVELSPDKLAASGITPGDVTAALADFHPGMCKGILLGPAGAEGISFESPPVFPSVLEAIAVRGANRPVPVRLGDVGTARVAPSPPLELFRIDGKQSLTLSITRDPNSSLISTARDVRSCIAGLSSTLPAGVHLVCEMDQSRRMTGELNVLYRDILISLLLLWGLLAVFLGSNRAPFILISSVVLSVAGTLLVLWMLDIPLHLLTLAGLVLGIGRLLDDSIVVLENLRRWAEPGVTVDAIVQGTEEVAMPVLASTLATAGAMAPVLFLPGDLKVYFQEFALAVVVSLCISLLLSFSVIPSAAWHWKVKGTGILSRSSGRGASLFRRLLGGALRHRALVLVSAAWLFGFPVWLLPTRIESGSLPAVLYNETIGSSRYASIRPTVNSLLGGASYQFFRNVPRAEFLDAGTETFLVMQVDFPQGTDIANADRTARALEESLLAEGAPRLTTRVLRGALFLRIDFPDSMVHSSLPRALRSDCFRLAAQMGGASVSVSGFGAGFSSGTEFQSAFTVRVLGYDYARVKQIAELLRDKLLRNPRVASADINMSFGNWLKAREIALIANRTEMERYNATGQLVAEAVQGRSGTVPQRMSMNVQGTPLPCIVTVKGSESLSSTDLGSILVDTKHSVGVPLRALVRVQQRPAPSEIVREDQQYVRWVSFEYKGPYRHAQAFLDEALRTFPLPDGYRFDRADMSAVSGKDRDALLLAALAALLVVFMVTASLYESLVDPFIIMLSIPFAYVGVFLAFVVAEMPFGRGGYLSVLFLTGIAVSNAIVVVDFIARQRRRGVSSVNAVIEASACRLRPVIMTTLATVGSLIPMLFGEKSSIWYSVALGTLGGILSSGLLTLVVIPVVYALAYKLSPAPPLDLPPRIPSLKNREREEDGTYFEKEDCWCRNDAMNN